MAHPHYEDDAQAWHTLHTSRFHSSFKARVEDVPQASSSDDAPLGSLRFTLRQPSMMWSDIELRHLKCYMSSSSAAPPQTTIR